MSTTPKPPKDKPPTGKHKTVAPKNEEPKQPPKHKFLKRKPSAEKESKPKETKPKDPKREHVRAIVNEHTWKFFVDNTIKTAIDPNKVNYVITQLTSKENKRLAHPQIIAILLEKLATQKRSKFHRFIQDIDKYASAKSNGKKLIDFHLQDILLVLNDLYRVTKVPLNGILLSAANDKRYIPSHKNPLTIMVKKEIDKLRKEYEEHLKKYEESSKKIVSSNILLGEIDDDARTFVDVLNTVPLSNIPSAPKTKNIPDDQRSVFSDSEIYHFAGSDSDAETEDAGDVKLSIEPLTTRAEDSGLGSTLPDAVSVPTAISKPEAIPDLKFSEEQERANFTLSEIVEKLQTLLPDEKYNDVQLLVDRILEHEKRDELTIESEIPLTIAKKPNGLDFYSQIAQIEYDVDQVIIEYTKFKERMAYKETVNKLEEQLVDNKKQNEIYETDLRTREQHAQNILDQAAQHESEAQVLFDQAKEKEANVAAAQAAVATERATIAKKEAELANTQATVEARAKEAETALAEASSKADKATRIRNEALQIREENARIREEADAKETAARQAQATAETKADEAAHALAQARTQSEEAKRIQEDAIAKNNEAQQAHAEAQSKLIQADSTYAEAESLKAQAQELRNQADDIKNKAEERLNAELQRLTQAQKDAYDRQKEADNKLADATKAQTDANDKLVLATTAKEEATKLNNQAQDLKAQAEDFRRQAEVQINGAVQELDRAKETQRQAELSKEQAIKEKEQAINEKDQEITKKEQAIKEKDQAITEKDQVNKEKEQAIKERDEAKAKLEQANQAILQAQKDQEKNEEVLNRALLDFDQLKQDTFTLLEEFQVSFREQKITQEQLQALENLMAKEKQTFQERKAELEKVIEDGRKDRADALRELDNTKKQFQAEKQAFEAEKKLILEEKAKADTAKQLAIDQKNQVETNLQIIQEEKVRADKARDIALTEKHEAQEDSALAKTSEQEALKTLAQVQVKLMGNNKELTDLQRLQQETNIEKNRIREENQKLNESLAAMRKENETSNAAKDILTSERDAALSKNATLEEALATLKATKQTELESLRAENQQLQANLTVANQTIEELTARLAKVEQDFREQAIKNKANALSSDNLAPELEALRKQAQPKDSARVSVDRETWSPLFTEKIAKKIHADSTIHTKLVVHAEKHISLAQFSEIFEETQHNLKTINELPSTLPSDIIGVPRGNLVLEPMNETTFRALREDPTKPGARPLEILKVVHKKQFIEIISTEPIPQDDVYYSMALAAKSAAEKLGKTKFNIENCEENPQGAFKLFLIGKSMGMNPVFKDQPELVGQTAKNLNEGPFSETLLQVTNEHDTLEQKTIKEVYTKVKDWDTSTPEKMNALKKYISLIEAPEETFKPRMPL